MLSMLKDALSIPVEGLIDYFTLTEFSDRKKIGQIRSGTTMELVRYLEGKITRPFANL